MRNELRTARSVVVKIGTSSLLDERGRLDRPVIARLFGDLVSLDRAGVRSILVTSGAIGAGSRGKPRPTTIPELQAAAAIGQSKLMEVYNGCLGDAGYVAAQLLLTHDDFRDRRRYLNIRNTLAALHGTAALPVVNENDTVAVDEIRLGDNDTLAALLAGLIDADVTILLSDVDGFHFEGRRLELVREITDGMWEAAGPGGGTGGMTTKLRAAKTITRAGGFAVIAHGKRDSVAAILRGEPVGTLFAPSGQLASRARWMHGLAERGRLHVDAGGEKAVRENGKSLLPAGITACDGEFDAGDVVLVVGPGGPVAKGLVNYEASALRKILGKKSGEIAAILGAKEFDEAIHRDNLVLL